VTSYYEVKPGQIWADNDSRSAGRTLRIDRIVDSKAVCTILANADDLQRALDACMPGEPARVGEYPDDRRGKTTRISLARFRPTNTGYRLVRDQQYGIRWGADNDVVFAYGSRPLAEAALGEDGRSIGILVVHEYEPGTPNCTEWREVED
jgi:hypothetical protein